MSSYGIQTCRACLLQDHESTMYDLTVNETLKLYIDCTNSTLTNAAEPSIVPQFICTMCYRLCELWQGFKDRCHESERKLIRSLQNKKKPIPGPQPVTPSPAPVVPRKIEVKAEVESKTIVDKHVDSEEFSEQEQETQENETPEETEIIEYHQQEEGEEMVDLTSNTYWEDEEEEGGGTSAGKGKSPGDSLSSGKKRKYTKRKPEEEEEEFAHLLFGPGPNEKGVWKYFLRDTTKRYGKCKDCGRILACPNGSTTGFRNHLLKFHDVSFLRVSESPVDYGGGSWGADLKRKKKK